MRIVQFLHGNAWGGMEKFCIDLSNSLVEEHDVMLIADPVFKDACDERIEFRELNVELSRNNLFLLFKVFKDIKSFHADILRLI